MPYKVTEEDLSEFFSEFASVKEIRLVKND
jgi:hypothetical protein